ncbi:hypothetical protein KKG31_00865 [Patescibacteria group bacterium]|nr:hypothetical protein [Patescibacteria group bacterium]MBU1757733.1 hypothetical protein [Patescibacteria group bacterium]
MADNDPKIEQMPEELVDNTSDINQVKANIDDLKTSVTTLQQEIEAFDKQKKDLAKEILEQKQKEIEQKKLEIENKKKETQELIDKIRKERIDLKLENLDDLAKQTFEEQRSKEEELLVVYEKDLKAIEPMKKTFWDKTKEI